MSVFKDFWNFFSIVISYFSYFGMMDSDQISPFRPGVWRSQDDYLFLYCALEAYITNNGTTIPRWGHFYNYKYKCGYKSKYNYKYNNTTSIPRWTPLYNYKYKCGYRYKYVQWYQRPWVGIFVLNIDNWHSSISNLTHLQSCGPRTMAKWLPTEWMRQGMFDIIISMQFRWKDSDKKMEISPLLVSKQNLFLWKQWVPRNCDNQQKIQ